MINEVEEDQNKFLIISAGGTPLAQARDAAMRLTSCALGSVPGSASSITSTKIRERVEGCKALPDLELRNRGPEICGEIFRYVLRYSTGHKGEPFLNAGKEMFGGALALNRGGILE